MRDFEYEVPYARHLPSVKLGRWNGKVPFFSLGGATYLNLLPQILPKLEAMGIQVELEDQRVQHPDFVFTPIHEQSFAHKVWPKHHVNEGEPIVLRDYQVGAVNGYIDDLQSIQEISTGAGKTIITAVLSTLVEPYGRSIVIVPSKSLVTQTEDDYINMGLDVGVFFGDRKEFGKTHTICTWQSLLALTKKSKEGEADITIEEFIEGVVCVICDEVHSAKAEGLKSMMTGVLANIPIRWGLTGTIPKEDFEFQALRVSIGEVTNAISAASLQAQGVLANCHVKVLQTQDTAEYKTYPEELTFLTTDKDRMEWLADKIHNISLTGNTLVLVGRIQPGKDLTALIPGAIFVSGAMKNVDRKVEYDDIATATNKCLVCTYGVAAIGINIPRVFNLVLVEPGKSFIRVIQSIGRGIRKAQDKDFVQIYDVTSRCKFSKRHLTKRKQFYKDAQYDFEIEKVHI